MDTRLDIAVKLIEKWGVSLIVLTGYYFLSFNVIRNAYHLTHLPPDERLNCGMPLLGCLIGQFILTGLASGIIFIRMSIGNGFSKKHYRLTTAFLLPPILTVGYIIFS